MAHEQYTFAEFANIHFCYGLADGNAREAQRLYAERFPGFRVPCLRTFIRTHQNLSETGNFTNRIEGGRPREVRNPQTEEQILHAIDINPGLSTRQIARDLNVSQPTVWRVLHENSLYPYHIQRVQGLLPQDFPRRLDFSRWILRKCAHNPDFLSRVLFSDEAHFTRDGIVNYHNLHVWAVENPHKIREARHQQQFSLNVWAGIVVDELIGPFFFRQF